ncbi:MULTISPECIES: DUF2103 domain-containing protein [Halobacterium]|uniref:DUF2103 domain-containing protein n=1 Tax=Halobacterium TaxID=2239 RepID=UPI001965B00B|nr:MULTISPECIES: DUF2103 domain-containing protein [Halobacterium]MCF2164240.1 DUF2103 domain-containing protein [Halobacterium salinarum]MCF2166766.1 DUF2103 domain-containing protein [Halobacterium salinarum]MCF2237903.1 DUF2103 domain-containing protein [Halobacterium salinarum]MDL0120187.1 DUF2103 domain-containing protein [Halobacterium salinarum]MDL0123348.1 DUF2103 domain-containing protein [Halobacterium salinarum]
MDCSRCGTPLDKPGDYCLVCRTENCDAVVADCGRDRATLTFLTDEDVVGRTDITTVPEDGDETGVIELRNFAGRIADEIRRKRPEDVFVAGAHEVIRAVRADLHHDVYRVEPDDPVASVLDRRGDRALDVVEKPVREKIGGRHSTLIGDRDGQQAIRTVAGHPNVKKVIPGPIDAGGSGSRTGVRAKVTRADTNGNLRLLVRDGSSVQENRVVTTAMSRDTGERVRTDLNDALEDESLRE